MTSCKAVPFTLITRKEIVMIKELVAQSRLIRNAMTARVCDSGSWESRAVHPLALQANGRAVSVIGSSVTKLREVPTIK